VRLLWALAGLLLSGVAAHAQILSNEHNPLLKITVIATSLQHPREYQALRVWLPFETSFTCHEGEDRLDIPTIIKTAEYALQAERKHITVRRVITECVPASQKI
jgi:hypothetical protein